MRRLAARDTSAVHLVPIGQLACLGLGTVLLLRLRHDDHPGTLLAIFACAAFGVALAILGNRATSANRPSDLQEAERVLKRMWRLGQQIGAELDPQRVPDRFLETVCDVARAEGGIVGLLREDGRVRVVVGTGIGRSLTGLIAPVSRSAMGRVITSGSAWTASDVYEHLAEIAGSIFAPVCEHVRGIAIVPITRRHTVAPRGVVPV